MSNGYQIRDQQAIHFITFAVVGWVDLFTRNIYKYILIDCLKYCQDHKGLIVHAWVIMTNHVHFILSAREEFLLSSILRDFKKFTSWKLRKVIQDNPEESRREWLLSAFNSAGIANSRNINYQLWRQDNHPVELNSNKKIDQRLTYLHNNPVKAGFVRKAEDYIFSSAYAYQFGKDDILCIAFLE